MAIPDYTIDVQAPFMAALQGYQGGAMIRDDQAAQQQAILQQQQQAAMRADIASIANNPNASARDFANLTLKYPALKDQFKQSWDMIGSDQQAGRQQLLTQAYAALSSNRPDIAESLLRDRAQAMRNSGAPEQEAAAQDMWADLIKQSPQQAKYIGGLMLSSVLGPEKFAETFAKLGEEGRANDKAPAELLEANSKAASAATAAKFAESKAVMDLKLSQSQIEKMAADTQIAKENARIAAINAATAREGNSLKKQELQLKLQEAITARDDKLRTKVAEVESARGTMDNFLNTADRLLSAATDKDSAGKPRLKDGKPVPSSTLRAAAGPLDSRLPTMQTDVADLEALAETLGSQAFLSQIPAMKGTGNLSEKEGDKLQSALTNLSLKQSPEQFLANIKEAQRLILKARGNLTTKYGVPDTVPDTPAAQASPSEVDDLVRRYTGSGR